jgi:autotransporter-associated beta strand protein
MGGGNLSIEGVISGTGPLTKIGPGTLELAGKSPNSYSGNTLAKEGVLLLSKTLGVSVPGDLIIGTTNTPATARQTRSANIGGAVTVNADSLYDLNDNNESIDALNLNGGGDVQTGTGQLTLDGDVVVNVHPGPLFAVSHVRGRLHVGTGERHFIVEYENNGVGDLGGVGDLNELILHARVAGSANIIKSGPGDVILTASNSFTGTLTVEDGELYITDGHGLGATSGQTILTGQASLIVFGTYDYEANGEGIVVDEPLFLNTTGQANGSALFSFGSNVWSGSIFLGQNTSVNVFTNHVLHLAGAINGLAGLTKVGPGTLIYSGTSSNTYLGATRVNDGTLRLERSGPDNLSIPGPLIVGDGVGGPDADVVETSLTDPQIDNQSAVTVGSSGLLRLRTVEEIGSLSGSGRVSVEGSGLIVTDSGGSNTYEGVISGPGSLTKQGPGTLVLNGNNTYTGDTSVYDGTLVINGQQKDSDVYVSHGTTLRGDGRVGYLSIDGTLIPGNPSGRMRAQGVNFLPGSTFVTDLTSDRDDIGLNGFEGVTAVDVTGANLDVSLSYAPVAGQVFQLGGNFSANPTTGNFVGRPEGAVIVRNHIPLHLSYTNGFQDNDITLTVGELALRLGTVRVAGGNGNGVIDPNECNDLFVSIENPTAAGVNVLSAHLQSRDNQLIVTQTETDYGTVPANSLRTNQTAFQLRTSAGFQCGTTAEFHLVVNTLGHGRFAIPVTLGTGKQGLPVTLAAQGMPRPIPDNILVSMPLEVTNAFRVARARVTIHTTHSSVGQLRFQLWAPDFSSVLLSNKRGGAGDNFGTSCGARTTFDDSAPVSITAGIAPFVGLYRPEESLASLAGTASAGTWRLEVMDDVAGVLGAVQCWSLELSPFECTDDGGACASCQPTISGVLNHSSPTMAERLWRVLPPSGCGDVQPCAGAVTFGTPPYRYGTHSFTNNGPETCVTVALNVPCTNAGSGLVGSAYLGDFNPAALCANLLGGSGQDAVNGSGGFSFRVPAGQRFTVVVNEHNFLGPFEGCGNYSLELYGLPCPQAAPALHIASDAGPDNVRLHWSTAYPGFQLQGTPNLGGVALFAFTNVANAPVVIDGQYSVTNKHDMKGNGFFRLRKP